MSDRWALAQPRYTRQLWWRAWTWHDITPRAHCWRHIGLRPRSWLRNQIVGEDPDPQYSELDREDGLIHDCELPGFPLPLPGDIWQCTDCKRWWVGVQGRWLSTTSGELPNDLIISSPYNTGLRFIGPGFPS